MNTQVNQPILFCDGTTLTGAMSVTIGQNDSSSYPMSSDNVLIQELVKSGAWFDLSLLEQARFDLRDEVMENVSFPDSFMATETKAALRIVSKRLKEMAPQSSSCETEIANVTAPTSDIFVL